MDQLPLASDRIIEALNRACQHLAARDFKVARRAVLEVLRLQPNNVLALALLGEIAMNSGRPACAFAPLKRCVRLSNVFAFRLLYVACLKHLGYREEAEAQREIALRDMPQTGSALFLLGNVFEADGDHRQAAQLYRRSLEIEADAPKVLHRLAALLHKSGESVLAVDLFMQAIRQDAAQPDYYIDLSSALSSLGRFDEARQAAEIAERVRPGNHAALHNLAHALLNLNRSAEAVEVFDRALVVKPEHPGSNFSRATALLKIGAFAEGWREYEWRWKDCQRRREDIVAPLWQGEDLAGKTILLHAEQGYGDSLQFVRFVPQVTALGAQVVLQVPRPLVRLFQDIPGSGHVKSALETTDVFDFYCPLASLPDRLGLTLDTIPSDPYLSVPFNERVRQGNAVRKHATGGASWPDLVVGLVWAGDPRKTDIKANTVDRRRSMPLAALAPLCAVPGVRFVSFQLGEARSEIASSGLPIIDVTDGIADFADTAARFAGIDLLIAVDTSIVHLAGGLGLPVWMLSRYDGCWRWLENRADTPWYPSMRILRQPASGDWAGVVAEARVLLTRFSSYYHRDAPSQHRAEDAA